MNHRTNGLRPPSVLHGGRARGGARGAAAGHARGGAPVCAPGHAPGGVPGGAAGHARAGAPGGAPGRAPGGAAGHARGGAPGGARGGAPVRPLAMLACRLACALVAGAALLVAPAAARAQQAQSAARDAALERVHNLIATGRFTEARNTLAQWETSNRDARSGARPADRARALYLKGVLSTDVKEAEEAFLGVVLSYPSTDAAPDALLRLGQGLLTGGEPRRAIAYLERLRNDYPGAPQQESAPLWLARAQLAAGSAAAACATARTAADDATSMNMRTLLELERDRACAPGAQAGSSPFALPARPAAAAVAPTMTEAVNTPFSVQTGAYRELSSAQNIANQMRARGFQVRVVLVGDSPLHRVRFGAFATQADAATAARTIRDAGFATVIVNDVQHERR
jgi:TolA-binding protein